MTLLGEEVSLEPYNEALEGEYRKYVNGPQKQQPKMDQRAVKSW